jgi:mono/diheme cytochrome c family protein
VAGCYRVRRLHSTFAKTAGLAALLAVSACTTAGTEKPDRTATVAPAASPASWPAPGGVVRSGDSFAMMAAQYAPRAGPYAATGASAWVPPAPAPAFVATGPPPPADPPPRPPAAVANRPPATPAPSPPAAEIARPEAAAPEAPAAPNAGLRTAGLALFNGYSCGTCHTFADAGASGSVGPSLDRNPRLGRALAVDVIANGSGAMPSFAGQMSEAEIATLADYLVAFTRK